MTQKKSTKKVVSKKVDKVKKAYVLDTNVLLHDPDAIFNFEGVLVGIPSVVLEELDKFKKEGTDRGRNTRETIRHLDSLRQRGSLSEGVTLDNGAIVKILFIAREPRSLPFKLSVEDNELLLAAMVLQDQGYRVKFISKDLNARVKAGALGLETQDYLREYVTEEEFYRGWTRVQVPAVQLKEAQPAILTEIANDNVLEYNQFVLLESQHNPHNYTLFRYLGNHYFRKIEQPNMKWPLKPRNPQQLMAMDLLLDPEVQFVSLLGPAGTGKTFLALLAGLHKVTVDDEYEKMLISRPAVPLGPDIGFLPGDIEEKLRSWMLPIYDNMEYIIHSISIANHFDELEGKHHGKRKKRDKKKHKRERGDITSLEELVFRGKISLEAITYMRGRSIPYQYILIDEAQNLTPHEVKTIVSRAGEGSKVILAGDPYQIDSPFMDFSTNGLVISSERFKGQKLFGAVFLETSERSELSKLASQLL